MVARFLFSLLFLFGLQGSAQERKVLSPRDSVYLTFGTDSISVNYGRPSMRGRVIMGKLVPLDTVWRTGANLATHLRTNFDLMLGGVPVPKGLYTLWTLPSRTGWKIIVNKQTGQWGTRYDERQDLARFDATVEHLPTPVDTFLITLPSTGPSSGKLVLTWENTRVSAPFEKNDHIRPLSPTDSVTTRIGKTEVKIVYSKPFMRGRKIWGTIVPYDSIWRTGANSPTTLKVSGPLHVGNLALSAGTYILRSIPTQEGLTLVISTVPASPGPIPDSLIVGRVHMKSAQPDQTIDPFHIGIGSPVGGGGESLLKIGWAEHEFSAPLTQ